jgi:hypothetical protein
MAFSGDLQSKHSVSQKREHKEQGLCDWLAVYAERGANARRSLAIRKCAGNMMERAGCTAWNKEGLIYMQRSVHSGGVRQTWVHRGDMQSKDRDKKLLARVATLVSSGRRTDKQACKMKSGEQERLVSIQPRHIKPARHQPAPR